MSFEKFLKKREEETNLLKYNFHGSSERRDNLENLWMVYETIKTNRKLVFATWSLAIATIILSTLTLFFQYFKIE